MRARFRAGPSRGFTLVELVVTMGIVSVLAGLAIAAIGVAVRATEVQRSRTTLQLLDAATAAWEESAGRSMLRVPGPGGELEPSTPYVLVLSEVIRALERAPAARAVVARIDPDRLHRYDDDDLVDPPAWIRSYDEEFVLPQFLGEATVLDAWGSPIYATHPGSVVLDAPDIDGTERTPNEDDFGAAAARRICFISAGPDRLFGIASEFPGLRGSALARRQEAARSDNVNSYPPRFD